MPTIAFNIYMHDKLQHLSALKQGNSLFLIIFSFCERLKIHALLNFYNFQIEYFSMNQFGQILFLYCSGKFSKNALLQAALTLIRLLSSSLI